MLGRHVIAWLSVVALVALALPVAASSADAVAGPVVSGVHANTGSTIGRAHVIIEGRGFTHVTSVYFGRVRSTTVNVVSARELVAYAPPQRQAVVHVTVRTTHGTSAKSASSYYRYVRPQLTAAWTNMKPPTAAGINPARTQGIAAVACPSTRCYFVGGQGTARGASTPTVGTADGGTTTEMLAPAPADQPYSGYAGLGQLTCASATFCVAAGENGGTDDNGILATLSHGSWTVVTAPSPSDTTSPVFGETITDVSCGAPGSCVALGYLNYQDGSTASTVLTLHKGSWSAVFGPYSDTKGGGSYVVDQLSCATASWCLMVGGPRVIVDQAGHFSTETIPEPPGAEWTKARHAVDAVSCRVVENCTMVISSVRGAKQGDTRDDFGTDDHGALAYHPITVPADAQSPGVVFEPDQFDLSCPSVTACFTYVYYAAAGDAFESLVARLDHGEVREYVLPQIASTPHRPLAVSSLACSSATACVAVGNRYHHVAYETFADGVWTPRVIAGFGQDDRSSLHTDTVSCTPSGPCLAAGGYSFIGTEDGHNHVYGSAFLAMGSDR